MAAALLTLAATEEWDLQRGIACDSSLTEIPKKGISKGTTAHTAILKLLLVLKYFPLVALV